jgi:hypothetical protein
VDEPSLRRPIVPPGLLARFADASGRVMAERRDRSRRLLLPPAEAAAEAGFYTPEGPPGEAAPLVELLDRVDRRAQAAIDEIVTGAFPPPAETRAGLALFVAVQLVLGRTHRERLTQAALVLGQLIGSSLPDDEAGEEEGPGPEPPRRPLLAGAPRLAGLVAARTWQLVRFPSPQLLTCDTPAVLWSGSGAATAYPWGLGGADEVRVPLDPRHALIIARRAPAGEVVRDLGERHARALNRTVAECAHAWMYYHPESDPMGGVELASA